MRETPAHRALRRLPRRTAHVPLREGKTSAKPQYLVSWMSSEPCPLIGDRRPASSGVLRNEHAAAECSYRILLAPCRVLGNEGDCILRKLGQFYDRRRSATRHGSRQARRVPVEAA